jgi:predicted RNA binding protein with dsRBD fold (UPF0201 family)
MTEPNCENCLNDDCIWAVKKEMVEIKTLEERKEIARTLHEILFNASISDLQREALSVAISFLCKEED